MICDVLGNAKAAAQIGVVGGQADETFERHGDGSARRALSASMASCRHGFMYVSKHQINASPFWLSPSRPNISAQDDGCVRTCVCVCEGE